MAIMIPFTWLTYKWGYKSGINAVQTIYESGIMDKAVRFANILGLVIVGCITGQYVSFGIGWSYTSGEMIMNIQGVLDGIFPGALPLLITIACWYLMDKKKVSMGKIMIGLFVICLVGKFLGIIA